MQVTCYIARYKKQDLKTKKGRRGKKSANYPSTIWLKQNYSPAQSEITDMKALLF